MRNYRNLSDSTASPVALQQSTSFIAGVGAAAALNDFDAKPSQVASSNKANPPRQWAGINPNPNPFND